MTNKKFTIDIGVSDDLYMSGMIVSVRYGSLGTSFSIWKVLGCREYYQKKTTEWYNTFKIYINPVRYRL